MLIRLFTHNCINVVDSHILNFLEMASIRLWRLWVLLLHASIFERKGLEPLNLINLISFRMIATGVRWQVICINPLIGDLLGPKFNLLDLHLDFGHAQPQEIHFVFVKVFEENLFVSKVHGTDCIKNIFHPLHRKLLQVLNLLLKLLGPLNLLYILKLLDTLSYGHKCLLIITEILALF